MLFLFYFEKKKSKRKKKTTSVCDDDGVIISHSIISLSLSHSLSHHLSHSLSLECIDSPDRIRCKKLKVRFSSPHHLQLFFWKSFCNTTIPHKKKTDSKDMGAGASTPRSRRATEPPRLYISKGVSVVDSDVSLYSSNNPHAFSTPTSLFRYISHTLTL